MCKGKKWFDFEWISKASVTRWREEMELWERETEGIRRIERSVVISVWKIYRSSIREIFYVVGIFNGSDGSNSEWSFPFLLDVYMYNTYVHCPFDIFTEAGQIDEKRIGKMKIFLSLYFLYFSLTIFTLSSLSLPLSLSLFPSHSFTLWAFDFYHETEFVELSQFQREFSCTCPSLFPLFGEVGNTIGCRRVEGSVGVDKRTKKLDNGSRKKKETRR